MVEIREFEWIAQKKYWRVVACQIPVSLFAVLGEDFRFAVLGNVVCDGKTAIRAGAFGVHGALWNHLAADDEGGGPTPTACYLAPLLEFKPKTYSRQLGKNECVHQLTFRAFAVDV